MDYTSLVGTKTTAGSIAQWINVKDTILDLAGILYDAQCLLYNGGLNLGGKTINPLRVRDMITTGASVSLSAGAWAASLPSDFISPIALCDPLLTPLAHRDIPSLKRRRNLSDGVAQQATYPFCYAIDGSQFLFDYAPIEAITLVLDYYARPAVLSGSNTTNFLTTKYSPLLRAACLVAAADFMNDDGKYTRNVSKLAGMLEAINVTNEADLQNMQIDRTFNDTDGTGDFRI
jgi:hypothetical protein